VCNTVPDRRGLTWAIPADIEAAREWAVVRMADLKQREFGHALSSIGPSKPLGAQGCQALGPALKTAVILGILGRSCLTDRVGGMWWTYAWDRVALPGLLANPMLLYPAAPSPTLSAPDVLAAAGWGRRPTPRHFVQQIRGARVPTGTALFDLIADAYGDKTGPGRTDVLPGVPRRLLLAVFEAIWGQPDPTWIYFASEDRPTRTDFPEAPLREVH